MLVNEISTKVKMWAIILTVETVGFLVHMDYKVKKSLLSSERNLRLLNDKTEDLSVRSLTKDNPTMRLMFEDAGVDV